MYWSLDRIVPQYLLGDNHRMEIVKNYLKRLKKEKSLKIKRG